MKLGQSIPIVDEVFHFTYVLNSGAAFGILQNQTVFFVITAVLVLGSSIYFFSCFAKEQRLARLGVALTAGGAVGNLIDRVKTGLVVDFFDFRVWPVFNIADTAIVAGICLLVLAICFAPSAAILNENKNGGNQF
jgi:signal peptidase II